MQEQEQQNVHGTEPTSGNTVVGLGVPPPRLRQWLKKAWLFVWPPGATVLHRAVVVAVAVGMLFSVSGAVILLSNVGGVRDAVVNDSNGENKPWWPFSHGNGDANNQQEEDDGEPADEENNDNSNVGLGGSGSNGGLNNGNGGQSGGNGGSSGNGGGSNGGGSPPPPPPSPGECPPFPAFPDENCTGWQHTGVALSESGCPQELTVPNATYDGCLFAGHVLVMADNITITRSRVEGRVTSVWTEEFGDSLRGLTLTDVEIDGMGNWDFNQAAIGNSDYICIRCHVHSTGRGANIENNVLIQDSYLHGWVTQDGDHETGIGSNGGSGNRIIHNNVVCDSGGCSAALSLYGDFAPITDWLVEKNLFNTNGSYCTYAGSVSGKPFPNATHVRYIDNRFGKKYNPGCGLFGPVISWAFNTGNVWSGNAWADGSGEVNP